MSTLYLVNSAKKAAAGAQLASVLVDDFCLNCGCRRLPWMPAAVREWLEDGFEEGVIREAIRRTSRAPRPSWAYLEAIMGYARASGCFDIVSFYTRKHRTDDDLPR